ncbi:MAG: hypothetical protein EOQ39_03685 [Mesorhizobium sp.]|uniref:hypothetical protein n=1 Tax=Mesorhizobium sp. TaxID=1871066 RepID=UPI000FE75767|nr:hypothetical protein [Mesorhizobium sp.]RWB09011.1 MAG: hypothetical protein EOQ37_05840 [Mesorhizobium sp.]RWB17432.1 MAG: hypothetical protein EOQ39_03685 [Mesorhizobium sp.]
MMLGILAAANRRRSTGPAPLASANFVTGTFSVGGVTVTAAEIVDHPELITGNGLEMIEPADAVNIVGDFLTVLLTANWTIVLEWNHLDAASEICPLALTGAGDDNTVQIRRLDGSRHLFVEDFAGAGYRGVVDSFAFGDGVHKIALTRTNSKLVFSADGRAVVTGDIEDFALSPTAAAFGGYPGWTLLPTTYIRSLKIYAPQNNSLLRALSV